MKRFTALILGLLPCTLVAQPAPFASPTAQWHVARSHPNGSQAQPNFVQTETSLHGFNGDTLINAAVWLKHSAVSTWLASAPAEPLGYVRQTGPIVLYRNLLGEVDTLYDFDLQVGDSVRYDVMGLGSAYLHVVSASTSFLAGADRRIIHFSEAWDFAPFALSDVWIEDIGSLHGPLFPAMPEAFATEIPDSLWLICYGLDEEIQWMRPGYAGCAPNIIQATHEVIDAEALIIAPNPGAGAITFYGTWGSEGLHLRFFDLNGRCVVDQQLMAGARVVEVDCMTSGHYIIEASSASGEMRWMRWVRSESDD